ncbi:class I adenylate-forming enzyme family protein [Streptomyces sp. NPDC090445]|uniref:class I adenylate-forming enzyme family protein n=1 Tax=Streptomyces sp. NPDC090445 TaxID=3365963 RepID=UPI0038085C57
MHWLLTRLARFGDRQALCGHGGTATYAQLVARTEEWRTRLDRMGVAPTEAVAVIGDTTAGRVALFLALAVRGNTVVPLAPTDPPAARRASRLATAHVTRVVEFASPDGWTVEEATAPDAPLPAKLAELRASGDSGLVLFSSGSTGEAKAALLSLDRLLARFRDGGGRALRTVQFMGLDHIGGINTLVHVLTTGGTVISEPRRSPEHTCRAVERHRAQLLPTTPSFLTMLLVSGAHRKFDLSSLELITYGTEPMREVTLAHLAEEFPAVRLKQTYGLTETGILPTRSPSPGSLRMDVGGKGFATRIVDGVLWIKSPTAMLGYLNAPDPFDADGWLNTGDAVEMHEDGTLRVIGRASRLINVGGEKVHPTEVENVLLGADNVKDAVVEGRPNPVTGQIVVATVVLLAPEDRGDLGRRLRAVCAARLAPYKVPAFFRMADGALYSDRFKRRGGIA